MKKEALNPNLASEWNALPESHQSLISTLMNEGQAPLFEHWDPPGVATEEKNSFLETLAKVDQSYPAGLSGYIQNARNLLATAQRGENPFEGFTPYPPHTVDLTKFDAAYDHFEAVGQTHFDRCGVVLVAGGLGERLGYSGIKLDIPVEVVENTTYLRHYAQCLLAMEARMPNPRPVPFIIMVSQDTGPKTLQTLKKNHYFGLKKEQVHLLWQELVPALSDNNASLALEAPYHLQLKPHGHGDIHMLLHSSGLAERLHQEGIEHLLFIQDTNGQVFNAFPAALGVSIEKGFDFNSIAVNRIPGEAVGGLARLVKADRELTLNVEYNQLDPMLRATVSPEGDLPNEDGFSMFPGNINVLIIRMESYVRILKKSQGIIAEFVNPKYADDARTQFKKPTRLETMMQDLPKLFGAEEKVGVSIFNRKWCFSPNKNRVEDAAAKHASGAPPESAATAESDFYLAGRLRLLAAEAQITEAPELLCLGVPLIPGPRVLLKPSFAMTLAEVREKVNSCSLSDEATLVLDGSEIFIESLTLSGTSALIVRACPGARVIIRGHFKNAGFQRVDLEEDAPEYLQMRGYRLKECGVEYVEFNQPGEYILQPPTP